MSLAVVVFAFFATSFVGCQTAYLRIIEAGIPDSWTPGLALSGSVVLCPTLLFNQFTVECVPDPLAAFSASAAKFYLNDTLYRRDFVQPFVLTGHFLSQPLPWELYSSTDFYPSTTSIACILSNGEEASATVQFSCHPAEPTKSPILTPLPSSETVVNVDFGGAGENSPDSQGILI